MQKTVSETNELSKNYINHKNVERFNKIKKKEGNTIGGESLHEKFAKLFAKCFENFEIPDDLNDATMTFILKRKYYGVNYRQISLLSHL